MLEAIANLILAGLIIVLPIIWIIALVKWDGKCHCDKGECDNCPYQGGCEHEKQEDEKK